MTAPACWPRPGTVNGVRTIAFCTDGTVMGGAMGVEGCAHIVNAYDTAIEEQSPIIGIWHSGGARLAEGVKALHAVGLVFEAMIRASGYVPQISIVVGFAAGGAAYGPALTDVIVMAPDSKVFVTGPDVVRSVTGEDVDMVSLGGPDAHHKKSGVCHIVADDELDAYERGRRLVGLFCQQGHFDRAKAEAGDTDLQCAAAGVGHAAPTTCTRSSRHCSTRACRSKSSRASGRRRSSSAWAGWPGRTVGVIANNPLRLGGCLNSESAEKAARFVRLCDAFGIPLVVTRRRARLPARCGPGMGRRRATRRETAARVRRMLGPARHAGDPEDLRRRLHRDELAVAGCDEGVSHGPTPRSP